MSNKIDHCLGGGRRRINSDHQVSPVPWLFAVVKEITCYLEVSPVYFLRNPSEKLQTTNQLLGEAVSHKTQKTYQVIMYVPVFINRLFHVCISLQEAFVVTFMKLNTGVQQCVHILILCT